MPSPARSAAATWTLWGLALAVLGLANLAVMGFDPVPNQHAVVGTALVLVPLLAGAATQAVWPHAPRWTWLAAALAAPLLLLLGSMVQSLVGNALLYDWGGPASAEAPLALVGALWAAALTWALRHLALWPGLVATGVLAGLYLWASSWDWGSPEGGMLFGGALVNGAVVVVFSTAGWATVRTARTQESVDPSRA